MIRAEELSGGYFYGDHINTNATDYNPSGKNKAAKFPLPMHAFNGYTKEPSTFPRKVKSTGARTCFA